MKNVVEDLVRELYDGLKAGVPGWKDTPENREDVLVYALNRLPAHYVATVKGEVLTKMGMESGQLRTDGTVALMEGFRFVAAVPRRSGGTTKPA
jgi:hypothetical protein